MTTRNLHNQSGVTEDEPMLDQVKRFFVRNIVMIIALILAVVVIIVAISTSADRSAVLKRQTGEIMALQQERDALNSKLDGQLEQVVRDATGGMDTEHKAVDDAVVREFLTMALTWDSVRDYLDVREQVMRVYDLDEESQFMSVFMPGEMAGIARTDPTGEVHYAYDEDLSNRFSSLESVVTRINGAEYSYVSTVTMKSKRSGGEAETTSTSRLAYDVIDGKIRNLEARTVPGGVKYSG